MSDQVTVTFKYTPDDPDPDDRTGLTSEEHDTLTESLMELGATDIRIEKDA